MDAKEAKAIAWAAVASAVGVFLLQWLAQRMLDALVVTNNDLKAVLGVACYIAILVFIWFSVAGFLKWRDRHIPKPLVIPTKPPLTLEEITTAVSIGMRSSLPQTLTDGELEARVRDWLDAFGLIVQKIQDPLAIFSFRIKGTTGLNVGISRLRSRDRYITIQTHFILSESDRTILVGFGIQAINKLQREMAIELARMKIGHNIPPGMRSILVERRIPTTNIDEPAFIDCLDEVLCGQNLVLAILQNALERPATIVEPAPSTPHTSDDGTN